MARYEASFGSGSVISEVIDGSPAVTNQKPRFQVSTSFSETASISDITSSPGMLWSGMRQGDASLVCRNLYAGNEYNNQDFVTCDLMNSYAWDTMLVFLGSCADYDKTPDYVSREAEIENTGAEDIDEHGSDTGCNIHDIRENLSEWTTEGTNYYGGTWSPYWKTCVRRGSWSGEKGSSPIERKAECANASGSGIGFRGVLIME